MNLEELIACLDARYGNPYARKECWMIQDATEALRRYVELKKKVKEHGLDLSTTTSSELE